ncbi:TonB-dependent receptor [Lutibacter maritimus]|uniref:Iron complex outermembrane recepter protein n=1 Tax=Lutibacter maritimus TaxID=593133 RepID=A0A1I6R6N4_9FLAO|nr:TonB-dependent receptor [Lutibacter maritimus]SFS60220.1 iron complex outermembrane recepter protein [Lutibacter maritimus]
MKKIFTLITVFISIVTIQGQNNIVKGKIVSEQNIPIPNVNVSILNTTKGTNTNSLGEFEINGLETGTYQLRASFLGYQTKDIQLKINNNKVFILQTIILQETEEKLNEIKIEANSISKFIKSEGVYVSKLPLKNIENPQVYNSISDELLKEQVVTNINDALKNATGVTRLWETTGRGGDGAEYYSLRGFSVQPSITNGLPGLNNGGLDPSNIERIEVIKGPSGTLYGSSLISYGGLINVVTKQPYEYFGGEISYTTGSYGLNRITADVNTPIGTNNDTYLRVNAAYHTQNSFQDAGLNKSFYIAPSLKFIANDKLTFIINTEILEKESVNAPMLFLNRYGPLSYNSIDVFEQNYYNSFTSDNLSIKNPTFNLQAQALYKLSDKWTSQTVLSNGKAKTDGYYSYLWDLGDGDTFAHNMAKINNETRTTDIQQNFIGDFHIGKLRNRVIVGLDYFSTTQKDNSTGWLAIGTVSINESTNSATLSQGSVDNMLAETTVGNTRAEQEIYSAYISDVLNLTPSLSAMASLRVDKFEGDKNDDDDDQTAFSPKLGLVYQPIKDKLSLFTNYMNGFSNVSPAQVSDADGTNPRIKTFEPEKANQFEVGVKANLFENKVAATVSYYNINVSNKLMTDPTNINNSIQGGEVESKGFELSFIANPVAGWNIIAGYSHNDNEVLKETEGAGYLGLRTEDAGPANLVNFWTSFTFQSGSLESFGIGFGGNYASEYNTLNRTTTGSFQLPSYTIVNGSLSYGKDKFKIILKLDNIANKKYYSGWSTVTPQKLRTISTSLAYKF